MGFRRYLKTFHESKCDEVGLTLNEKALLKNYIEDNRELLKTLAKL